MIEDYFGLPSERETFEAWCQEIDTFDTDFYERLKTTGITAQPGSFAISRFLFRNIHAFFGSMPPSCQFNTHQL